jgi:hypothetical protein
MMKLLQDVNKKAAQYGCVQLIETDSFLTKDAVFLLQKNAQSNSLNIIILSS